jgi:bifunctional ADP-heptose synthase (sugar kinase/adenylyltransferase)
MATHCIVSSGLDPIHEGYISLIKDADSRGDGVIVLFHSDAWLCRKKGINFMKFAMRNAICENLKNVIDVIGFGDRDNSVCDGIRKFREKYPSDQLVSANGGDRTAGNILEREMCNACNVIVEFEVGGEHGINSSSSILKNCGSMFGQ